MSDSFGTPWTVACQAPLSMEFPKQEYWSGLPFPSPGDLPDPGIEPGFPVFKVNSLPLSHLGSPDKLLSCWSSFSQQDSLFFFKDVKSL